MTVHEQGCFPKKKAMPLKQDNTPMKKILIFFTVFPSGPGGSEFLPLSFISELQKTCDVTLVLEKEGDIEGNCKQLGISIDTNKLSIIVIKEPSWKFISKLNNFIPFYRTWHLKRLAKDADICISCSNMVYFGKPAHHFIFQMNLFNDEAFSDFIFHRSPSTGWKKHYRKLRKIIAEYILRPLLGVRSARKILANSHEHIYSNSFYVDKMIRDFYGPVNSTVFYPPTIFDFNSQDIVRDPLRVVCLGRIDPEKQIEDIIEIVSLARNLSQMDLKLYIGGGAQPNCQGYMSMLKEITSKYDWIVWQGEVYGKEKEAFLLSGTFAVHTRRDEEFGISITEYLKAGLVAIVPNEGGACEIINSPDLSFDTNEKAASILARLLSDTEFFQEKRSHCNGLATYFTRDEYLKRQKNLLSNIISTNE